MDSKRGIIINFTPTGMIPGKDTNPHVPITPDEIIKDTVKCARLGANVVHLHARDADGSPTFDKRVYEEIILGVREKSDIVISVSCSGRSHSEFEKRSEVLDLRGESKPEMASLTLSSLNFNKIASVNSPDMIHSLAAKMLKHGIKPEMEVFDVGMVNYSQYMIRKGLITQPFYFNVILGNIACAQAKPLHFGLIMEELPLNSVVTVGGVGDFQHSMNVLGLIFADGVRVGLEDTIYLDSGRMKLATNEKLVSRVVSHARNLDLRVATPDEVRERLNLPPLK